MNQIVVPIESQLIDLANTYRTNRLKEMKDLRNSIREHHIDFIQNFAHRMKGSAACYGMTDLGHWAIEMEAAVKTSDFKLIEKLAEQIQAYLLTVDFHPISDL
jgi:chemotaxis protein histidine kinase CheA